MKTHRGAARGESHGRPEPSRHDEHEMTDSFASDPVAVFHQIVSMQLSWNCNAACRQCMVSGHERRGRVVTFDEAKRVIDRLEQLPLTKFLGFTGGEVFLYPELLLRIAGYLHERHGLGFGVATNCFWAVDDDAAARALEPLVRVGLAEVLLSLDDFHTEFVPADRVVTAVRAALRLGLDVTVQTIRTATGHRAAWFQEHLDIPRSVRWVETPCHPAGRALRDVPESEFVLDWTSSPGHCTALRVWNIDPSGWVTPCCGTAFARRLRLGNAFREDLDAIVNRCNVDPLLNTVAAWGGPYLLIQLLESQGDTRFTGRRFASHCHACDVVLRDPEALAVFERELPKRWGEALASRLVSQQLWYRSYGLGEDGCDWLPAGWVEGQASPRAEAARHPEEP